MPKKGSRKVQFEIRSLTVEEDEDGFWTMRVVQEGDLGTLSEVARAIEEAKAQAPNVVVSSATVKEIATGTVEPGQTGTVPQDTSDPPLGSSGNLPFSLLGPNADQALDLKRIPDAKELHKRVRRTQGKEA